MTTAVCPDIPHASTPGLLDTLASKLQGASPGDAHAMEPHLELVDKILARWPRTTCAAIGGELKQRGVPMPDHPNGFTNWVIGGRAVRRGKANRAMRAVELARDTRRAEAKASVMAGKRPLSSVPESDRIALAVQAVGGIEGLERLVGACAALGGVSALLLATELCKPGSPAAAASLRKVHEELAMLRGLVGRTLHVAERTEDLAAELWVAEACRSAGGHADRAAT